MLYLNPDSIKIKKARKHFVDEMYILLIERINKIQGSKSKAFIDIVIKPNLREILNGSPHQLFKLHKRHRAKIESDSQIKLAIQYVFQYENWFDQKKKNMYCAYTLAEDLDVRSCLYCNRNYTNTVISTDAKKKLIRPEFDHFLDKDSYPLLALSFHNLIPCCHICNSNIKAKKSFSLKKHIHPYFNDCVKEFAFSYKYSYEDRYGIRVKINTKNKKIRRTLNEFAIEEIYNSHSHELIDLIKTKQYFSERYIDILKANLLKDIIVSDEELYRLVFNVEFDENKFYNRPFSKFKKDILKELGIKI